MISGFITNDTDLVGTYLFVFSSVYRNRIISYRNY